jgi:hypothetical protein
MREPVESSQKRCPSTGAGGSCESPMGSRAVHAKRPMNTPVPAQNNAMRTRLLRRYETLRVTSSRPKKYVTQKVRSPASKNRGGRSVLAAAPISAPSPAAIPSNAASATRMMRLVGPVTLTSVSPDAVSQYLSCLFAGRRSARSIHHCTTPFRLRIERVVFAASAAGTPAAPAVVVGERGRTKRGSPQRPQQLGSERRPVLRAQYSLTEDRTEPAG